MFLDTKIIEKTLFLKIKTTSIANYVIRKR